MRSDETSPALIIVCGLPGSGKTTLARELEQQLRAVRFAPDEWIEALGTSIHDERFRSRVEELQWRLGKQLLALGVSVIIEWGTWARSERNRLRTEARALGAGAHLHYLVAPPIDVLFARLQKRNAEVPPIPRSALDQWADLFEQPSAEERELFDACSVRETHPES